MGKVRRPGPRAVRTFSDLAGAGPGSARPGHEPARPGHPTTAALAIGQPRAGWSTRTRRFAAGDQDKGDRPRSATRGCRRNL